LLAGGDAKGSRFDMGAKSRLKGFMTGENKGDDDDMAAPIADLFPHCTVFFGGKGKNLSSHNIILDKEWNHVLTLF
jgi:hypothetical protein